MGNNTDASNNTITKSNTSEFTNIFNSIFNQSNVMLLIWFLAIYFILYLILGVFFKKEGSDPSLTLSRSFDVLVLIFVVIVIYFSFYSQKAKDTKLITFGNWAASFSQYLNNPASIFSLSIFLLVFYILIYLLGVPMTPSSKPVFISIAENVAWILFVMLLIIDFFKYMLGIPIVTDVSQILYDWWNNIPENGPNQKQKQKQQQEQKPVNKNEVFNVSNNLYTYDDAQAVCAVYDASLATYDQIEHAYNNGGEWCNYGWSDGQMAYFPTQKSTWNALQKTDDHKNDCGRPGINGGYIANPYVKFGVNCYGKKPKPTAEEKAMMVQPVVPKNAKDAALEKKTDFWKQNAAKTMNINSFNTSKWSENNK